MGSLWQKDKRMALVISVVMAIYLVVHLIKLEVYPFYLFAMFSQEYPAQDLYSTYTIYSDDEVLSVDHMDYRQYTYLMNTIAHFDDIKEDGLHEETKVISKFLNALGCKESSFGDFVMEPHRYEDIGADFQSWMNDFFDTNTSIRIEKEFYSWQGDKPVLESKTIMYEMD